MAEGAQNPQPEKFLQLPTCEVALHQIDFCHTRKMALENGLPAAGIRDHPGLVSAQTTVRRVMVQHFYFWIQDHQSAAQVYPGSLISISSLPIFIGQIE